MTTSDTLIQQLDLARQHLTMVQQQMAGQPGKAAAHGPALQGLGAVLLSLQQGIGDLARQNETCTSQCRELELERALYRDMFEFAPHSRLLTDLDGIIQSPNVPAIELLRVDQPSLMHQSLGAFLSDQDREGLGQRLERLRRGQEVRDWEVRLRVGSGPVSRPDLVPASVDAVPVRGKEGAVAGVQWLLRDMSRQAAAEESLRRSERLLRSFLEQYQDGIALTDEQGCVIEWNQAMERITGLCATDVCGRPIWDVQFDLGSDAERTPAAYEQLSKNLQDVLRTGQAPYLGRTLERELVRGDGVVLTVQGVVFPIRSDRGSLLGSVTRDVTERRRAEEEREQLLAEATKERQRAEHLAESLEDERSTFRAVIESTHTQLAYLDPQFNFLLVNSAYAEGSGHRRDELIGRNHFALFPNAENEAIFVRVRDTGEPARFFAKPFEFADQPERGTTYWDWSLVPVQGAAGEVQGLVLSLLDTTEQVKGRMQIEALSAQLQRKADELTAVLNAMPESVAVWDAQGHLLHANPISARFGIGPVGVQAADLVRERDVRWGNGSALAPDESVVARALRGETVFEQRELLRDVSGEPRDIVGTGAPVCSGGEIVAAVVVTRDVTEQRRIERERERLLAENQAQREFLARLVETAPVGIAVLRGPEHRYELVNPYYQAITGVPGTPMVGRTIVEVIPDLVNRRMPELMDEVYRTGQTVSTREVELSFGPGREQTYWDTDRVPLRRPDGSVDGILVLAREVTRLVQDRKRIEALSTEARRHADELEAVVAALVDPLMILDARGRIVLANPAAVASLGIDPVGLPEAELGRRVNTRYPDGRPTPDDELVAARALRGEKVAYEYQILHTADGGEHHIVASAAPIVSSGRITGAVIGWHDISDLRQTESALRESEAKLRALFELMPIGVSILDSANRVTSQNAALAPILGLSRDAIQQGSYVSRSYLRSDGTPLPPNEFPSARAAREQRPVHDLVGAVQDNGSLRWLDVSAAPVPFVDWKVVVATVDVTERRQAEAALRQARDELEVRIRERTRELESANLRLVAEVHERTRAEGELRQSEQRLEQRVEERTRELTTLLAISNTVALSIDLESLLALILERLRDVVDYDGGGAFRLQEGKLNPVFHRGTILPEELLHIGSHLERAALGHPVVLGPEPMIVPDVQGTPDLQAAFRQATGPRSAELAEAVRAWMAVPVTIKQQVYGVLYMYHHQPGLYGEEQARLALPFGNQAAVAIENARLYEQAQALAAVEERQHLARELHDAVTQTLFSASLAADVLPRLWERDREAGMRCLSEVHQRTRGALAEMRTLLLELRPAALVETEPGVLLRQLAESISSRAQIEVTVEADLAGGLPPDVQVALYRIAQEALNNVAKHAGARHVTVGLHPISAPPGPEAAGSAAGVLLSIADDGCGFDLAARAARGKGLGLGIMRERAQSVGAEFRLDSRPGEGTQIVVTWPGSES